MLAGFLIASGAGPLRAEPIPFSLGEAFKDDFLIGAAFSNTLTAAEERIVARQLTSITAENPMKPKAIQPSEGNFSFGKADYVRNIALKYDLKLVGHTLLWPKNEPDFWFNDVAGKTKKQAVLDRLQTHTTRVAGRYSGQMYCWDVVNEALNWKDTYLIPSPWLNVFGNDDFILEAFRMARLADPTSKLIYNDYLADAGFKRANAIALAKKIRARGDRIDGIGIQNHARLGSPTLARLEEALIDYRNNNLEVSLTELDMDVLGRLSDSADTTIVEDGADPYPNGVPDWVLMQQADEYAQLFKLVKKHADAVDRVTFWNLHDGQSWLNNYPVQGRTNYPLLWDRQQRPKPAYDSVMAVARGPGKWIGREVGTLSAQPSAALVNGQVTLTTAGTDIAGTREDFGFVYQPLAGDGEITIKLESSTAVRVGVMMRESGADNARHVMTQFRPNWATKLAQGVRAETGGSTAYFNVQGAAPTGPIWLRLTRKGDTFTSFWSSNGTSWTLIRSIDVPMAPRIMAGVAACTTGAATLSTTTFGNATVKEDLGVAEFRIIHTQKSMILKYLKDQDVVDVTGNPPFTIEAVGAGPVGSMEMAINSGAPVVDGGAPFTFGGDNNNSVVPSYNFWLIKDRPKGTVTLRATARPNAANSSLPNSSKSITVTFLDRFAGLTDGWWGSLVGVADPTGLPTAALANGELTISSSGSTFSGSKESFGYAWKRWSGDGTFTARVDSTDAYTVGLMFRESLDDNSRYALAQFRPTLTQRFTQSSRSATGGGTAFQTPSPNPGPIQAPVWLRITRTGNTFESFWSSNGQSWTSIGTTTTDVGTNPYVGFAVISNSTNQLATAKFSAIELGASPTNSQPLVITGFQLINPDTNSVVRSLSNGDTVDVTGGLRFNVAATATGPVGQLELGVDAGAPRIDPNPPYTFGGDNGNAAAPTYNNWTSASRPSGTVVLKVTAKPNAANPDTPTVNSSITVNFLNRLSGLPAGFAATDVGSAVPPIIVARPEGGGVGNIQISAAGNWVTAEVPSFGFVHRQMTGDGAFTARIDSLGGTASPRAGVVVRENLTSSSRFAMTCAVPPAGGAFVRRTVATGTSSLNYQPGGMAIPAHLKIERRGDLFISYTSMNGTVWTQIGSELIPGMPDVLYVGMSVTSSDLSTRATGTFSDFGMTSLPTMSFTTWMEQFPDLEGSQPGTDPAEIEARTRIAYALGLDPTLPLPTNQLPRIEKMQDAKVRFVTRRSRTIREPFPGIQISTDLALWENYTGSLRIAPLDDMADEVSVVIDQVPQDKPLFFRLKVD